MACFLSLGFVNIVKTKLYMWSAVASVMITLIELAMIFRLTPPSRPNKAGFSVRPHLSPSVPKMFFFDFSEICRIDEWWGHPLQPKVKVTELQKLWKWLISKSISSAGVHVIKRLTVNYETLRQYLNFNVIDIWYSSSFGVMWPSDLGCSTFGRRILPLTSSQSAGPVRGLFIKDNFWLLNVLATKICYVIESLLQHL